MRRSALDATNAPTFAWLAYGPTGIMVEANSAHGDVVVIRMSQKTVQKNPQRLVAQQIIREPIEQAYHPDTGRSRLRNS